MSCKYRAVFLKEYNSNTQFSCGKIRFFSNRVVRSHYKRYVWWRVNVPDGISKSHAKLTSILAPGIVWLMYGGTRPRMYWNNLSPLLVHWTLYSWFSTTVWLHLSTTVSPSFAYLGTMADSSNRSLQSENETFFVKFYARVHYCNNDVSRDMNAAYNIRQQRHFHRVLSFRVQQRESRYYYYYYYTDRTINDLCLNSFNIYIYVFWLDSTFFFWPISRRQFRIKPRPLPPPSLLLLLLPNTPPLRHRGVGNHDYYSKILA